MNNAPGRTRQWSSLWFLCVLRESSAPFAFTSFWPQSAPRS